MLVTTSGELRPGKAGPVLAFAVAWQDWRAENGGGFGYFPTRPSPDTEVQTAAGDVGRPVRYLGDGWWWVN